LETGAGVIVITHYARILRFLTKLDKIHVIKGKSSNCWKRTIEELEVKVILWLGLAEDSK